MSDANTAFEARVNDCMQSLVEAFATRNSATIKHAVAEFSDALADFKRNFTNEALELAAKQYVPPTAVRNIVETINTPHRGLVVRCDDNTLWMDTGGDGWVQVPSVPNTVPE